MWINALVRMIDKRFYLPVFWTNATQSLINPLAPCCPLLVYREIRTDVIASGGLMTYNDKSIPGSTGCIRQESLPRYYDNTTGIYYSDVTMTIPASELALWNRQMRRVVEPGEDVLDLVHAPLWGLARSAQAEHPDRRILLVDLDTDGASPPALSAALASDEPQLALRRGELLAPRLARRLSTETLAPPDASTWRLHIPAQGTLDQLTLVACPEAAAPLADGQVRIAVRAAGLNFRDVAVALGMVPNDTRPLGGEGAGVVVETGPGVTRVAVGDRVMGLFHAAFAPVAVADQRTVTRIPEGWSFAEAASVPVVFLTAYYALVDLAHLRRGERLLVHAAAGGVGTAAVQIARHLGAEVFATVSPGKWSSLRALGFDEAHLASSRTLEFEPHFLRSTEGRGMDVVLDCLAREFVDASLRLLPRGGRFVEMGKSDIRDSAAIAAQHPGVGYGAFDLIEAGPDRIAQMLSELTTLFERGALHLPLITTWDVRRAPEAFRALAQARLVGKAVLTVPHDLDRQGTVLITGATGTLGRLVARRRARHQREQDRLAAPGGGDDLVGSDLEPDAVVVAGERREALRRARRGRVCEDRRRLREARAHRRRCLEVGLPDVELQHPHAALPRGVRQRHQGSYRRGRHRAAALGDLGLHGSPPWFSASAGAR